MIAISRFADQLSEIPESDFTHQGILDFLKDHPIDMTSMGEYLYFAPDHYTRNLIRKTELFELIAICWEVGQKSPIHNHRDQNCWMAVPYGKLQVHDFAVVRKVEASGYCALKSSRTFLIEPGSPAEVDPSEPVHQVLNPASFRSRAVSLHIYSRPFDTCEVYELKGKSYQEVQLVNTSEYGVLKRDSNVEKASLQSLSKKR